MPNWKIINEILRLAIPTVGEMILYMMIWIFDTMMVGKYGGQLAVSSVGLCTQIIYSFFDMVIAFGLSIAITSLISRLMGSKKYKKAEEIANTGFKISIFLGIFFFGVLFFFPIQILHLAGATKEMLPNSIIYAKLSAFSFFILSITATMNGVFRGVKNTKISMYVAGIINIVNLSLDYLLIFGKFGFPELGIKGAAIATIIGNLTGLLFQYYSLKKLPFKIKLFSKVSKENIKEIIYLAIPSGLQEGNFSLAKLLGLTFIMRLGSIPFAANQIVSAIEAVSIMPGIGVSVATTTLVGHSVGENNLDKNKEYILYSLMIASIIMGTLSILFFFIPQKLVVLFIQKGDIEVINMGVKCLRIAALEQIPTAFIMVLGAYFKGWGDTKTPFYISFFTNWFLRVPLAFYFIYILRYPVYVFWIITVIQWSTEGIIIYIFYKKKLNILNKEN